MTINLTEEQVAYLQEFVSEKLEDNLDLEEAEMLHDLADKLNSDYYDDGDDFSEAFGEPKDPDQIDLFDDGKTFLEHADEDFGPSI